MPSRTRSRSPLKTNAERKFPIRVRFKTPEMGYGARYDEIHEWLRREIGHGNFVWTSDSQPGHDASSVYLRSLSEARKLLEEFDLELLYLEDQKLV